MTRTRVRSHSRSTGVRFVYAADCDLTGPFLFSSANPRPWILVWRGTRRSKVRAGEYKSYAEMMDQYRICRRDYGRHECWLIVPQRLAYRPSRLPGLVSAVGQAAQAKAEGKALRQKDEPRKAAGQAFLDFVRRLRMVVD